MMNPLRHGLQRRLIVLAVFVTGWSTQSSAQVLSLYVSPDGRDTWSGRVGSPNADKTDGPLATPGGARDAIRRLKKAESLKQPIVVRIRGGQYFLSEPFVLTSEDSGTEQCPVTYAAQPGEQPVISGGRIIRGWRAVDLNGKKAWAADLPEVKEGKWYFTQLFVDGRRRPRTRLPKEGLYHWTGLPGVKPDAPWNVGQNQAAFEPGQIKNWQNLSDVEVIALHLWVDSRLPIAGVDEPNRIVQFSKKSVFKMSGDFSSKPGRYFVENVFEALEIPGQWYLNRKTGVLYYLPMPGEEPDKVEVVAPRLDYLLRLEGKPADGQQVHDVHFRGLTFRHTEWSLPPAESGSAQAAVSVPGTILWRAAKSCSLCGCTVEHVSGYAIELTDGATNNRIVGNDFHDLGAGGVKLAHATGHSVVSDNRIGDGGHIHHAAVGVWVGQSSNNTVIHNDIHHFYYTGVSVGWSWGYAPTSAQQNLVEYNHIHHIGQGLLSDMGGIYTLGVSPGTKLRFNHIHDVESYGYGGWGIYTDEGSSTILIENNVVYRTKTGGFHQHYGRENVLRNNVFAMAREGQLQRTREEDHLSFTFERNIVYWENGPLLSGGWKKDERFKLDYNVYWLSGGRPFDFGGASWDDWRKRGHDLHSVIADPLFVDPAKGDFTLKPDSPALKLGFKPIDLRTVGPRAEVVQKAAEMP